MNTIAPIEQNDNSECNVFIFFILTKFNIYFFFFKKNFKKTDQIIPTKFNCNYLNYFILFYFNNKHLIIK